MAQGDYEKFMKGKTYSDPATKVPKEYHGWLDVFSKDKSDELPPHRPGLDHEIKLTHNDQDRFPHKTYGTTQQELKAVKKIPRRDDRKEIHSPPVVSVSFSSDLGKEARRGTPFLCLLSGS